MKSAFFTMASFIFMLALCLSSCTIQLKRNSMYSCTCVGHWGDTVSVGHSIPSTNTTLDDKDVAYCKDTCLKMNADSFALYKINSGGRFAGAEEQKVIAGKLYKRTPAVR